MEIKIDKEFHALIPPLSEEEYKGLEQSLIKEGNRDALVVWNNIIIDGHNRYEICQKHNIKLKQPFVEKSFENREEVKLWIINNQLSRRNISEYSRIYLEKIKDEIQEIRKKAKEQKESTFPKTGQKGFSVTLEPKVTLETAKEIAKRTNLSKDKIYKQIFLEKKADEKTKKKLFRGDISLHKAYSEINKKEKEKEKIQQRKQTAELFKDLKLPDKVKVIRGDFYFFLFFIELYPLFLRIVFIKPNSILFYENL